MWKEGNVKALQKPIVNEKGMGEAGRSFEVPKRSLQNSWRKVRNEYNKEKSNRVI